MRFLIILLLTISVPAKSRNGFNIMKEKVLFGAKHSTDWLPVSKEKHVWKYVVNGQNATFGKYPSILSLQVFVSAWNLWVHICGAIILTEKIGLSAAHCMIYWDRGFKHRIAAGWHKLEEGANDYQQLRDVSRIIVHEEYVGSPYTVSDNDIVMLFWDKKLKFNTAYVQAANIGSKYDDHVGKTCELIGWGRTTSYEGSTPEVLQSAYIPVISQKLCRQWWELNTYASPVSSNLCGLTSANGTGQLRNACSGDSGGPLYCDGVVAGLVSWGRLGCLGCTPDVYTKMSAFWRWVNFNRRTNSLRGKTQIGLLRRGNATDYTDY